MQINNMKQNQIKVILLYNSKIFNIFKISLLIFLISLTLLFLYNGQFSKIPLFILSISLIIDTFIIYGIGKISPSKKVNENPKEIIESFTKESLQSILFKKNIYEFLDYITHFPQANFILEKAVIFRKEIPVKDINFKEIEEKAFDLALKQNGKYVTTGDLITAYLILIEDETKLLFGKEIKEEDLININKWARVSIHEEYPNIRRARFVGTGLGETLVWGWTPEAKNYTKDHTFSHIKKHSLVEGREKEYGILIEALQKPQNNNVLIVGELGTGKSNLVENLIFESYESKLPKKLNHKKFLEVMVGEFIAGSANREDLETRLQELIAEIKHSGNVILFIPEFQNLLGSSSYNIDLSGAIFPYLKDGKMPIIATMTKGEYKKYFENNSIREVFEVITLEEPNFSEALKMLFQKTDEIEEENNVILSYAAVVAAVRYADKFELNAVLPGTAVDLLNTCANSVKISRGKNETVFEKDVVSAVEQKSKIPVGAPTENEKIVLLNLESEMHKYVIGQNEAITKVSEALRRIRAGLQREKPISFLFLGPTGVGKTETAKTLSKLYFGGEANIIRLDMSEYGTSEGLSRLIQSGAGSFLDNVMMHPFSLILLDEFEKADSKILNLFLQVLDDGRMTDSNGKTISFNNSIIIATSNAGSEYIRENVSNLNSNMLLDYLQKKGLYSPELLNRFDEVVVFKPLNEEEASMVANLIIDELSARLALQDVYLKVTTSALKKISKDGFNFEFGARPLRRFVQDNIEDEIAKKMLSNEISRGDSVVVDLDSSGNLEIKKKI